MLYMLKLPKQPESNESQLNVDWEASINHNHSQQSCKQSVIDMNSLSQATDLKMVKSDLQLQYKTEKFSKKMSTVLQSIKQIQTEQDIKLVFKLVLQAANDYLHHPDKNKLEIIKAGICESLLKPYMNGDENLTKQVIQMVMPLVKSSTFYRRNKKYIGKGLTKLFFFL